jgi:hypothetical protein
MRQYWVFVFRGVAIAECASGGNALYYHLSTDEEWRQIFCLTKSEARKRGARRIIHSEQWRTKLHSLIEVAAAGLSNP